MGTGIRSGIQTGVRTGAWFWVPIALLVIDALYLSYFWVWRKEFYFPERYETAFAASAPGLVVGLVGFLWLAAAVVRELRARRSSL
jgi:hypothetical protein